MRIIRERTEAKEIAMSRDLVMSRAEWLARNATYRGTIKQAEDSGYFTARKCAKIGKPVSDDEMRAADNFAEFRNCYMHYCLERNGKKVRPNIPVFYRGNSK